MKAKGIVRRIDDLGAPLSQKKSAAPCVSARAPVADNIDTVGKSSDVCYIFRRSG